MSDSDLVKVALTCAAFMIATLLWVFCSKQQNVPRTFSRAISITLRIAIVHAVVVGFFYGLDGIAIDTLLKWLPIAVVLMLLSKPKYFDYLEHMPDLGVLLIGVFALVVGVFVPLYLMKQFVLGFPDKIHWDRRSQKMRELPEPQLPASSHPDLPPTGTAGTVSASLRPMGTVEIEGTAFPARHVHHHLLDVGTDVVTCGSQNGALLVKQPDD